MAPATALDVFAIQPRVAICQLNNRRRDLLLEEEGGKEEEQIDLREVRVNVACLLCRSGVTDWETYFLDEYCAIISQNLRTEERDLLRRQIRTLN
jgi:hypothetical protein